jgi:hypothetical protein
MKRRAAEFCRSIAEMFARVTARAKTTVATKGAAAHESVAAYLPHSDMDRGFGCVIVAR